MSFASPLTLAIVKIELGIMNTDLDTQITERIPFAESKFRKIASYQFDNVIQVFYDIGEDIVKVFQEPNSEIDFMDFGDLVLSEDFTNGTYVIRNFRIPENNISDERGIFYEVQVTNNATADSKTNGSDMIVSYNISNFAVLSQIVFFMIGEQDVTKVGEKSIANKRIGPVALSFGPGDINQRFGLPNKIVQQIPKHQSMY